MSENSKILAETQRWLIYAQRDLRAAQTLLNEGADFTPQICFLSQQTAEKAIKAGLIFLQAEFPFTHDLDRLRELLPKDWHCRQQHSDLGVLTEWAVASRYPNSSKEPSYGEAEASLQQAGEVLKSILQDLERQGMPMPAES